MAITEADRNKLVAYRVKGETAFWGRFTHLSLDGFARIVHPETGAFEGDALARMCDVLPDEEQ